VRRAAVKEMAVALLGHPCMHNRHHRKATIREGVKEFRSQEASIASSVFP
jgi:uncharacterized Zn-binding protein involved in type VI secretion